MHRRGIATVEGDKVVLDGTTVEEVRQCHRDTLILAANEANRRYVEHLQRIRQQEGREAKRIAEHKHAVEDIAGQIDFDNV